MRHFDAFTHPAKEDCVVADNIAGTDCLNPDLPFLPFSDKTFSRIDADLTQIAANSVCQDFRNLERRPARRIFFQAMMGDNTQGIRRAREFSSSNCEAENPVVPITIARRY